MIIKIILVVACLLTGFNPGLEVVEHAEEPSITGGSATYCVGCVVTGISSDSVTYVVNCVVARISGNFTITLETPDGNIWAYEMPGYMGMQVGSRVSVVFADNGTDSIYDDEIVYINS